MKAIYLVLALLVTPLCKGGVNVLDWVATVGGGSSFNPQTQGTLVNWYDASTLGLANGASVMTFPDSKTGNPNQLSSIQYPTYNTNQQNGLGTVSFSGDTVTTQFLNTGGSSASTFPYTIAVVLRTSDTSGSYTIMGPSGDGGVQFRVDQTTGYLTLNKANVAAIGTGNVALGTAAYHLVVATVNSTNWAFYIDGVAAGSGTHSQTLTAARTWQMGIKGPAGASAEYFKGRIGEVMIFSSVLNATELGTGAGSIREYCVAKWATP